MGFSGFIWLALLHVQIPLIVVAMMMAPMIIDGVSQLFGFRESNNALRLFTGFMFTFGLIALLVK